MRWRRVVQVQTLGYTDCERQILFLTEVGKSEVWSKSSIAFFLLEDGESGFGGSNGSIGSHSRLWMQRSHTAGVYTKISTNTLLASQI